MYNFVSFVRRLVVVRTSNFPIRRLSSDFRCSLSRNWLLLDCNAISLVQTTGDITTIWIFTKSRWYEHACWNFEAVYCNFFGKSEQSCEPSKPHRNTNHFPQTGNNAKSKSRWNNTSGTTNIIIVNVLNMSSKY